MDQPIRVVVVDDSAFMRQAVARYLERDPAIRVIGTARDGVDALEVTARLRPDVLTLDVEMPNLDGLATLQQLMAEAPLPVIMLSSLTQDGSRTTIQALMRGAVDFVAKPDGRADPEEVFADLVAKIKVAAGSRPGQPRASRAPLARSSAQPRGLGPGDRVVVIGASTGGPRALQQLLAELPGDLEAAVTVVQHMPGGFTRSLAARLNELCALEVREAGEGDRLLRGQVLVAPGGYHLRLRGGRAALDEGPRRNHVRPAIDVTMEDAAEAYGRRAIGVVLTGMGQDGTAGAARIKAAGGRVIAEHEETAVVDSMPRSVAEAGLADAVVPLDAVAAVIERLVRHGSLGV